MGGYAKEDWVEENFLPSSGGILCVSGDSSPLTIKGVGDDAYIDFRLQSNAALSAGVGVHSSLGPVFKNNADGSQAQPLIHSGDIKNYAPTYSANGNVGIGTESPNYKKEKRAFWLAFLS